MRSIAIVGMACRYPDARSPQQLWENVLAERRAFRRIPAVRLRIEDYQGPEDSISCDTAAVIEDFEFDRARYRISAPAYRCIDLSHWLAIEVSSELLERLPHESLAQQTGVFVGNTLTSEFARANLMRLRWPYVERVLRAALHQEGRNEDLEPMLAAVEQLYKSPFPPTGEESLAGGLSNTIAGRICNTFNFRGGGFTIDGACASSLLAVANACSALESGSLDLALAGGVDLSLDPFELAGFSALSALAGQSMRVYDRRPTGFWPGEGCGFVALMREEAALARGIPVLARIRGWGISSDGYGSITRPEPAGQILALERAYRSAGHGIETIGYFEGHGTGTAVGDATELAALQEARRRSGATRPAAVGSIKTLIGHTKAAAGVASLIKAVCAVNSQIIPATAGCEDPHPIVSEIPELRCPKRAELWPAGVPLRAGVSAMGFGGINAHVTIEGMASLRRTRFNASEQALLRTRQDCELFPLSAEGPAELRDAVVRLGAIAEGMSFGELSDCSAALTGRLNPQHAWRAAVVAAAPSELTSRADRLAGLLQADGGAASERILPSEGVFYSSRREPARIGFLFPGQSSPVYRDGGAWSRRFSKVDELYGTVCLPAWPEAGTQVAQPAVAAASLAGWSVLRDLEIEAQLAAGHSLGELLALCWAGAIAPELVLELAAERGRLMGEAGGAHPGAMLSIAASRERVESVSRGLGLVIACHNSPVQTVVSGPAAGIDRMQAFCSELGIGSARLPLVCAFHSPLMHSAAEEFARILEDREIGVPERRIISSVTGSALGRDACVRRLLRDQIVAPVEFARAMQHAYGEVDLWFEVGPGHVLAGLVGTPDVPVVALDSGGSSLAGICHAMAAAFVLKRSPSFDFWFRDRLLRPFRFEGARKFLANPCESVAFTADVKAVRPAPASQPAPMPEAPGGADLEQAVDCLLRLRQLVARHSELPLDSIGPEHRFLSDLHLNSITVAQLVAQAAGELGFPAPVMPVNYSTVTLAEAAAALEESRRLAGDGSTRSSVTGAVAGVDSWVRPFTVEWVAALPPKQLWNPAPGIWQVFSDSESDPVLEALKQALEREGSGLLVYLADPRSPQALEAVLAATRELSKRSVNRVVLVEEESAFAAFFRSLFLEHPPVSVTVITGTAQRTIAVERLVLEAMTTSGFREVSFDRDGVRRERRIRALPFPEKRGFPLAPRSRLLVTGGGRGIGLECALELARRHDLKLVIVGRAPIDADPELSRNLERLRAAGIEFTYHSADVADANSVRDALAGSRIDGVIHAAGINIPERACELTAEALRATLAPKCDGLRNIRAALEASPPKLVATFGSVIAQTGLDGEAHYALANDWMGRELAEWAKCNPTCHALHIDWSVWAGVGMGERLGSLAALVHRGIAPISIESGVDGLDRMICGSRAGFEPVILSGRFGALPTLPAQESELPLLRFLESQLVHVPGVELICDAVLNDQADPYFADHEFDTQRLLPAVIGLEAMAQACSALQTDAVLRAIEDIEFARPIVLPRGESRRIRVAALVREPGVVDAVLRSDDTGFQVNHFGARFVFEKTRAPAPPAAPGSAGLLAGAEPVALDPERDLYGSLLFHGARFRRIAQYLDLGAMHCRSVVRAEAAGWFGSGMPGTLLLGDPGARDAAIHSIQACIPQATLLPIRVGRITILDAGAATGRRVVSALERRHQGDDYVYDLEIRDAGGGAIERWEGLELRNFMRTRVDSSQWAPALLVPYLEWAAAELGVRVRAAVRASAGEARTQRRRIVADALAGKDAPLRSRPDGKPETDNGTIAFSHMEPFTLGVHSGACVSCDLVDVQAIDPAQWSDLLGEELYPLAAVVSAASGEPEAHAAARIWAAFECLRKADSGAGGRLTFVPERSNGWTCFSSGTKRVVVGKLRFSGMPGPVAVGILVDPPALTCEAVV